MKIPIFPGKYHQNGGLSMAMLVSRSVFIFAWFFTETGCAGFAGSTVDPDFWHISQWPARWMMSKRLINTTAATSPLCPYLYNLSLIYPNYSEYLHFFVGVFGSKGFWCFKRKFSMRIFPILGYLPAYVSRSKDPLIVTCHLSRQLNTSWTRNYTQVVGPVREGVIFFVVGREGRFGGFG